MCNCSFSILIISFSLFFFSIVFHLHGCTWLDGKFSKTIKSENLLQPFIGFSYSYARDRKSVV